MSRGVDFQKIINQPVSRDWQNIPVERIGKAVKRMPAPAELDPQEKKILVSFYLNRSTLLFFKKEATRQGAKYQRMLRAILELYKQAHE